MAKKTTKTTEEQPKNPYALALGLIQSAKGDETKSNEAAQAVARILNDSSNPERQVLHHVVEAIILGKYDKAEFHLLSLMQPE